MLEPGSQLDICAGFDRALIPRQNQARPGTERSWFSRACMLPPAAHKTPLWGNTPGISVPGPERPYAYGVTTRSKFRVVLASVSVSFATRLYQQPGCLQDQEARRGSGPIAQDSHRGLRCAGPGPHPFQLNNFQTLVGALLHAATVTRPDIGYTTVSILRRSMSSPRPSFKPVRSSSSRTCTTTASSAYATTLPTPTSAPCPTRTVRVNP